MQTCFEPSGVSHELGSYVYMGYEDPDPDYSLIEVKKDLSGYIKHGSVGSTFMWNTYSMHSKQRSLFVMHYDTGPNPAVAQAFKHVGAGAFEEVLGIPNLSPWGNWVQFLQGKLRSVAWPDINNQVFYESDDGEAWSALTGLVNYAHTPSDYTVLGARLIAANFGGGTFPRISYSDDAGVSWTDGTGITTGITSSYTGFHHSGSNVLVFLSGRGIWRSTDGAAWTFCTGTDDYGYVSYPPLFASDGAGTVLFSATDSFTGYSLFGRSTNHGNTWSERTYVDAGIPDYSTPRGLYWDGTQFVAVFHRDDTGEWQVFTSPTGLDWTPGILVPEVYRGVVRIID